MPLKHSSSPKPPTPTAHSSTTGASKTTSTTTTLVLLLLLFLCLFPNLFHLLWTLPLGLLFPPPHQQYHHKPQSIPQAPATAPKETMWYQKQFTLPARARGSYLITDTVLKELPEIRSYKVGLLHLFIQHTSCALSLNENWDEDVRADMSDTLDRIVPEAGPKGEALYRHDAEGPDDLPAHVKSALIGASVTIPIKDGKLATGTWQGIWYLEFRAAKHTRKIVATIQGEKA
ncbi:hypothetical protein C7999DRAFT_27308 [Corynascus novoguineensis]|uniref:Uncharacterized protein n=1 Tax=Corynascus novoguineensis TaxID=1126955 RepID=A0AAN7D4T5_9PEZI|nr:hypothetical protein C7999DRAFT_27308 [Corynascus novoguineensis]